MSSLDSILDNQEVTNEIMTAIAVDLGASDITFSVNEKFGADKLNSITSDLVTSGILFNGNKCEISVVNNKIYIDTGIMVFADGKKKTITSKTELADVQNCYLYAYNNTIQNSIDIILNDSFPANTDIVKLARIENSQITDFRTLSKSKYENAGERTIQEINVPAFTVSKHSDYRLYASVPFYIAKPSLFYIYIYNPSYLYPESYGTWSCADDTYARENGRYEYDSIAFNASISKYAGCYLQCNIDVDNNLQIFVKIQEAILRLST